MREIKFRCWHKRDKEMVNFNLLELIENIGFEYGVPENLVAITGYTCSLDENVEKKIMQYTGLKDKNNVEIYEGDIVNFFRVWVTLGDKNNRTVIFQNNRIVVFQNGAYFLQRVGHSEINRLSENAVSTYQLEVIGNIYENPELLKGDKK